MKKNENGQFVTEYGMVVVSQEELITVKQNLSNVKNVSIFEQAYSFDRIVDGEKKHYEGTSLFAICDVEIMADERFIPNLFVEISTEIYKVSVVNGFKLKLKGLKLVTKADSIKVL